MTAICPRCGTVSLVGSQTMRFSCKTCHLRFCNDCQHWKMDRKQRYCARCGAAFSVPPPVMPWRISAGTIYIPVVIGLILAAIIPLQFWQLVLLATLPPIVFSSVYVMRFSQHTGLTLAARREVVLLVRHVLTLVTIIYVAVTLGDPSALAIALVIAAFLGLTGLLVQHMNAAVVEELCANRCTWEAVLSRSNRDALLMRFPDVPQVKTR